MKNINIDERFFELSPAALDQIREFKQAHNSALVQPIFDSIVRHYLPDAVPDSKELPMEEPFVSFGLDSFTLLEIVADLQDALDIRLLDEDLRELRTLKDAYGEVVRKAQAARRDELPPASAAAAA